MKVINLDPAEEWLAQYWLENLYYLLDRNEIANKIKIRLYEYVYSLLEKTKQFGPPYDPDLLFEDRKILKKIETELPSNRSGLLIPTLGGFIMKVKFDENNYRKRFTTAHEIGHTFFYDVKEKIPLIRFNKSRSRYWLQEDYANEIAATMLLPECSLRKVIDDNKLYPSLKSLEYLSKLYRVSYDVLHRRIVRRLGIWDCMIFKSKIDFDGTIRIDTTSISKGVSYKGWNIPKVLRGDPGKSALLLAKKARWNMPKILRKNLYLVLDEVFKKKIILKDFLEENLKDKERETIMYSIQSKLLKDNNLNSSISLIVKKMECFGHSSPTKHNNMFSF